MANEHAAPPFTVFHILADLCHALSILILLWTFYRKKSAEGVSLLTQMLYVLVFVTRYLDLFWVPPSFSYWLFFGKLFFLTTSILTVFLMLRVFTRTREREAAWKITFWSLAGCSITAPIVYSIFKDWKSLGVLSICSPAGFTCVMFVISQMIWTFSIELESICVIPQLLLLRQTSVPTVLDSYYLLALGSYRFLYILNWIVAGARGDHINVVSVIFGVIQTLLYVDFAWVYYSRQRVKLRAGGVVDSDDLSKSFLVRRIIDRRARNAGDDGEDGEEDALAHQENGTIDPPQRNNRWGARGISVSADDTLPEHELDGAIEIAHPDQFQDDDDEDDAPLPLAKDNHIHTEPGKTYEALHSSSNAWSRG